MHDSDSRRQVLGLGLGLAAAWAWPALAVAAPETVEEPTTTYEGRVFRKRMQLAGTELQLNGTGVRAVAWFKGYVAGLYLAEPARTPAAALAQRGPKRVQLHLLHDVPVAELVKALDKGMKRNASEQRVQLLSERMVVFATQMLAHGPMRKGDVIDLDLLPERGTVVAVNGKVQGETIAGEDFYETLLASFVGDRPYDRKLKSGLLGLGGGAQTPPR